MASFAVRLCHGLVKNCNSQTNSSLSNDVQSFQKTTKSFKKDQPVTPTSKLELFDLRNGQNVKLIVEIYKENKLIYSDSGYNQIIIKNIILKGFPYMHSEPDQGNKKAKQSN